MSLNSLTGDYYYIGDIPKDHRRVDLLATKIINHHKKVRTN